MTKTALPAPRARFMSMPADAREIVTEEAAKSSLTVDDFFPDYVRIQSANAARKGAVLRLLDAGHAPKVIAKWFGVTYVAVMQAKKARDDAAKGAK